MTVHNRQARPDAGATGRNLPLDALRGLLVLLVVVHHAILAYHPYAPPPAENLLAEPRLWPAFPIVDAAKAPGLDLLVGWNDIFFMSLFFLVSGVFAWISLARKMPLAFMRARLTRLGIPFLIAAGILAPLAYLPTYLAAVGRGVPQPGSFFDQWLALGSWPAGPAWFLWVLLAFAGAAALAYRLAPGWGLVLGRWSASLGEHPVLYLAALVAVSAAAYLPLAARFGPEHWFDFGPFFLQVSRSLHYAVYFLAGAGLGAAGLGSGLLDPHGRLAQRWPLWLGGAALSFVLAVAVFITILSTFQTGGPSLALSTFGNFTFVLCCAATSLACLALALRFAQRTSRVFASLAANAYGIYLLHYASVSWLQFGVLDWPASGLLKAVVVIAGAILVSWTLAAALRRIPAVRRVV